MQFSKGVNDVVPGNDGKSLVLTTSKQTLKVFNFRPSLLSTAPTNESKGRNESGWGGVGGETEKRKKRKTNMTQH